MPKSRSRKPKSKPQRAKQQNIVSMPQVRAQAAFNALEGKFVRWADQSTELEGSLVVALAKEVHAFLACHAQLTGKSTVTEFTDVEFQAALEMLEEARREEPSMFNASAVVDVYLHFLSENHLWSSTDEAFVQVHSVAGHGEPEDEDEDEDIIVLPEVDDAQAFAYFNAMPLVRYARSLLAWIGESKEVTATGVLKLKDVIEAAALVGRKVRTSARQPGDSVPVVRSMREVEVLDLLWISMIDNGLITLTSTKVMPTDHVRAFLDDRTSREARENLEHFIGTYLRACGSYIDEFYGNLGTDIRGQLMQLLDLALYKELQPEVLRDFAAPERTVDAFVHSWMQRLEALGIVQIDTHYRVPLELTPSIDEFTMYVMDAGFQAFAAANGQETSEQLAPDDAVLPGKLEAKLAGKSLRLRADLEYTQPPIWRRLEVPASMTLPDLHRTLQLAFGWNDSHLHDFELENRGQILRFSDGRMDEDNTLDEYEFTVGQLASSPKNSFHYNYDYGDSWRLKIVVEEVFDTPDGQVLRCTGGRLRAPVDDIGGIPGWYHAIEVMADPTHPNYEHISYMLGLQPGERFDPKDFSAKELDQQFARMLK